MLMSLFARLFYFAVATLIFVSCKQGTPQISNLKALPGFVLDQNAFAVGKKLNPAFVLTGKCDSKFISIEISFDDGATWTAAAPIAYSSLIDCQGTGKFRLNYSAGMPTIFSSGTPAGEGRLAFRATSDLGYSEIRPVSILQKQQFAMILAGTHSTANTGNTRRLTGRVGGSLSAQSVSGGYRLTGSVVGQ